MLRLVLCAAYVIGVFAALCAANEGGRPDCRAIAMSGPLMKHDYEDDTPGMPPPPMPPWILPNASICKRRNATGTLHRYILAIIYVLLYFT